MGAAVSQEEPQPAPRPYPPSLGPRTQEILPPHPGISIPPQSGNVPIRAHPPVQQKSIIRNSLTLQKNTLRVVPSSEDAQILLVDFSFNADVPGNITVYYHAREMITYADGSTTTTGTDLKGSEHTPVVRLAYESDGRPAARTPFNTGHSQWYRQHPSRGLDTKLYSKEQLLADGSDGTYALVIRLEAAEKPKGEQVQTQTTFAVVQDMGHQGWKLRVIAQQILIQGSVYKMMDLFGIGAINITASKNGNDTNNEYKLDSNQECVICLSEPCSTAVRPCHHLCLCTDCARILCSEPNENRRRCPVCRTKMESVFTILPPSSDNNNDPQEKEKKTEAKIEPTIEKSSGGLRIIAPGNSVPNTNINHAEGSSQSATHLATSEIGETDSDLHTSAITLGREN